jgi:hypothetical protein
MSIRAGKLRFQFLLAGAAGLTCAATVAIGLTINWLRADAIAAASRETGNLAVVLADQIANSIQSIDLILNEIKAEEELRSVEMLDRFDRASRSEDTHKYLVDRLSHLPQADFITLADKDGMENSSTRRGSGRCLRSIYQIVHTFSISRIPTTRDSTLATFLSIASSEDNSFLLLNASMMATTHSSGWSW